MADRETGFKVTDKRKFNPDGTPREAHEGEASQTDAAVNDAAAEETTGNVVSFPADVSRHPAASPSSRATETERSASTSSAADASSAQAESEYNQERGARPSGLPDASFLGLVNMLGVEAAMHLGLIETPGEEPPPLDLEAARHLIDTLGMLQNKTRGNLTADEDNLLDNVLADLRMQFVAISRSR